MTTATISSTTQPNPGMLASQELDRLRTMGQIVAGLAHDIDNPLGIVSQAAEIIDTALASGHTDAESMEDIREAARLIRNGVSRAVRLVKSFRNVSNGQMTEAREEVDIRQLIDQCVTLFRVKARGSGITITIHDRLLSTDCMWNGFPGHLSQILLNLLSNAERYAYAPGMGGLIEITLSSDAGFFIIGVRDYGRGVDQATMARLFDPYFTTGRGIGGTGLGMGIVKSLIETSLSGHIEIDSAPDKGMKVTFTIARSL